MGACELALIEVQSMCKQLDSLAISTMLKPKQVTTLVSKLATRLLPKNSDCFHEVVEPMVDGVSRGYHMQMALESAKTFFTDIERVLLSVAAKDNSDANYPPDVFLVNLEDPMACFR